MPVGGDAGITEQRPDAKIVVLVVEDELLVAMDLCAMVEDLGYAVLGPAPSTERALLMIKAQRPAVAILDENLAGVSVLPVANELVHLDIPFGIVSGHGRSPSNAPHLQNAPRLAKPTASAHVREMLQCLLSGRGSQAG